MSENRRFYWLKLHKDFFRSKRIKALRKLPGGAEYTVIYLKMQLLSLEDDGILYFSHLYSDFADELALDLDEEPDAVRMAMQFLLNTGLMEKVSDDEYLLPFVKECTGSEGVSAERVRNFRERKALQCNANVTEVKRVGNVEKEIEIEIEKDIDSVKRKRFQPPTLDDVRSRCKEMGYQTDPERFFNYYESNGWKVGKNKMVSWEKALAGWNARDKADKPKSKPADKYGFDFEQRSTDYDAILWDNLRAEYAKG